MNKWKKHEIDFMTAAWRLAMKGKGDVSPNPMVGALVVRGRKIVGEGWHKKYGGPHAEVFALKQAGSRAKGATLYVTLEPCAHFGHTPPCADLIIACGIKEVIIGMKDPNPLMNGKSIQRLRQAGIKTKVGLLAEDFKRQNEVFIKYITKRLPFVTAKIAQTLDGKVATAAGESKWITGEKARAYTHELRNGFDAILVGINTVLKDDPQLNASRKKLTKVIVDSRLNFPLKAKLLKDPHHCVIATTMKATPDKRKILGQKGVEILVCPSKEGKVDLAFLMKELAKREIASLLIEGGPQIIGSALKARIVDKLQIVVAPKIIGDAKALSSVQNLNVARLSGSVHLVDRELALAGEDLIIDGYVKYV